MAWGIIIPEVFLSRMNVDNLENELEVNNRTIRMYEGELIALATYSHPTIKNEDGEEESIVEYAPKKIREIMDSLEELHSENKLLYIAIDKKSELTKY